MLSPLTIARALGGDVIGRDRILAPGPGHSARDRSLSIRIDEAAPDGFLVFSHAGDDPLECKTFVRARLGLGAFSQTAPRHASRLVAPAPDDRGERAEALWREAHPIAGTPAEQYLWTRGLSYHGAALRWHPSCPFGKGVRHGCMVGLVRNIVTDKPQAIHRTAIDGNGRKIDRKAFGPVAGGAIKLTADEDITMSLGIGEGIESVLSLRGLPGMASLPVWSLIAANQVAAFPVLSGIESIWIAVDEDRAGRTAAAEVTGRWHRADREVTRVKPARQGEDLNDLMRGRNAAA